jgi:hypothetical protein
MAGSNPEPRSAPPDEAPTARRITPVRVILTIVVLAMVAMWIYALGPWAREDPPGRLDDPAFAEAAEPVCATTVDELATLPQAYETETPEARADAIDDTNDLLTAMVTELRAFAPTTGDDGNRVNEWLDDWLTYIGDRSELADELHDDHDARLHETAKADNHISEAIDFFAVTANDMPSCATPDDIS